MLADVQGCDLVPYLSSCPSSSGSSPSLWAHAGHSTSDGVTLPSFSPSISTPSLHLNRASPFSLEAPVSDLDSWGKGQHPEAMLLPGPADGGLLRELTACLRFGVGKRDDIIVLAPVLVHGCVQDAAAGGAGSKAGVVQHRNCRSGADNSGVVTLHELFIHLLVPLLSQGGYQRKGKSCEWGEWICVVFPFPACQGCPRGAGIF